VTVSAVEAVTPALDGVAVFFLDRLSRATLSLAAEASKRGAVVVFEPSGKSNEKLMAEAITLAHIVKYANERVARIDGLMGEGAATVVEIQTLGELGLKYRHRLNGKVSEWANLDAIPAPRLTDTCGSGDWCTAGLIAKAAAGGQPGLRASGEKGLRDALIYGQALAAWNCGFEGARGGMYAIARSDFEVQISRLLQGQLDTSMAEPTEAGYAQPVGCPACPANLNERGAAQAGQATHSLR
jgi:fructokinase